MLPFRLNKGEIRFGTREGSPPGPVVTYRLSQEEIIAKYGPPKKKKKNTWSDLFYEKKSRTGKKRT